MAFPLNKYWQYVLYFKNSDASGFSESYYNLQADVADPTTIVNDMFDLRRGFLNENSNLFALRISDPGKFRDIILPPIGTHFGIGGITGAPMAFESAFLFRLQFADNNVRPRALHGFTNGDMAIDGTYVIGGPTDTAPVNAFWAFMIGTFKMQQFNQAATVRYPTPFTDHILTAFQYFHFRQHDIGRPFGLRRGRASPSAP